MSLNFYCQQEEYNNRKESINKYEYIFSNYENNPPSLKEALIQMFSSLNLEDNITMELADEILIKCKKRIDSEYDKIKKIYENITLEDAYIICSYTYESENKEYSPYRLLNLNLYSDDIQNGVLNISKYLYILLKSLRKLPRYYPENKYLYRYLTYAVNISKETPYISGNRKTLWGFISTSLESKDNYLFLKKEKINTIFTLGGDIWGYDLELFNYYNEKEILIEPERTLIIDEIIENSITKINCTIVKTPLILNDNKEDFNIDDDNKNYINNSDFSVWYKYIVRFEIETKEKEENISGIGILCNIPSKKIYALITFNHIINFDFLNKEKVMIMYNNNEKIEIDMKINRYKYTHEDSNITIIEIVEEDKIDNFIEIDTLINSVKFDEIKIIQISLNENKSIESFDGEIIEKNNKYICSIESKKDGIILLKENNKCIGLIYNNEIIPMNLFIDKINFIKCVYDIKTEDIGKEIQIINNINSYDKIVNDLDKEIKVIINGEIKLNILKHIFENKGKHIVYLMYNNNLTNISRMFYRCSKLEKIDLSLLDTSQVTDMMKCFMIALH